MRLLFFLLSSYAFYTGASQDVGLAVAKTLCCHKSAFIGCMTLGVECTRVHVRDAYNEALKERVSLYENGKDLYRQQRFSCINAFTISSMGCCLMNQPVMSLGCSTLGCAYEFQQWYTLAQDNKKRTAGK